MSAVMSYKDFRHEVLEGLRGYRLPQAYLNELDRRGCIERAYLDDLSASGILGTDQTTPSGFVYACHMLYPDYPPGGCRTPLQPVPEGAL